MVVVGVGFYGGHVVGELVLVDVGGAGDADLGVGGGAVFGLFLLWGYLAEQFGEGVHQSD